MDDLGGAESGVVADLSPIPMPPRSSPNSSMWPGPSTSASDPDAQPGGDDHLDPADVGVELDVLAVEGGQVLDVGEVEDDLAGASVEAGRHVGGRAAAGG